MDVPVEQHVEQVVHVPVVPWSAVDVVCVLTQGVEMCLTRKGWVILHVRIYIYIL